MAYLLGHLNRLRPSSALRTVGDRRQEGNSVKSVLIACAYFDWFSNYQEIGIARALSQVANVDVIAGNRVNPIFSDLQLEGLGHPRAYVAGTSVENGVKITRFPIREIRSMALARNYRSEAQKKTYDLVIQVMPGHLLPALATNPTGSPARVVLYGDNAAMYSNLSPLGQRMKRAAFSVSKGLLYLYCNRNATIVGCYTPDTVDRIRPFLAGSPARLIPLTFDENLFRFSPTLREETRQRLGIRESDRVILTAGKSGAVKRIDQLVRAFDKLADDTPEARLLIVGNAEGPEADLVREAIASSPHNGRIIVVPLVPADELNALFNASDLGTWPFQPAVTIQQAMGSGLPVVIPNNEIVSHLVREAGSGIAYSVPQNSREVVQALTEALRRGLRLQNDDFARVELAKNNLWLSAKGIARELLALTD